MKILKKLMKPFHRKIKTPAEYEASMKLFSALAGPLLFAANLQGADENTLDPSVDAAKIRSRTPDPSQLRLSLSDMPKPWRWDAAVAPVALSCGSGEKALRLVPYGMTRLRISMFDSGY